MNVGSSFADTQQFLTTLIEGMQLCFIPISFCVRTELLPVFIESHIYRLIGLSPKQIHQLIFLLSNQDIISPNNINRISSRKVRRI